LRETMDIQANDHRGMYYRKQEVRSDLTGERCRNGQWQG
jgi:hypothetical protein